MAFPARFCLSVSAISTTLRDVYGCSLQVCLLCSWQQRMTQYQEQRAFSAPLPVPPRNGQQVWPGSPCALPAGYSQGLTLLLLRKLPPAVPNPYPGQMQNPRAPAGERGEAAERGAEDSLASKAQILTQHLGRQVSPAKRWEA
ncbi:hypothetical protein MC885_008544 [Smutsia gigantea]|nr:hypothetical protein MC885_008544 [Smutsia gigantea]